MMTKHIESIMTRLVPVAFILSLAGAPSAIAATSGSESLGGKLLDDLNPGEFGPPATSQKANQSGEPPAAPTSTAAPTFQKRISPDLSDGVGSEDVGQPSGGAALEHIERQMKSAQSQLDHAKAPDRAVATQQQVVADLDALIEQLSKRCQSGSCNSSGQRNSPSQRTQTAGAKLAAKPGKGSAPARDSTTRIGRNVPGAVDLSDHEQLIKDFWGHLPPHAREQMLQSHTDEFLPQYELEIEQYYRRLSAEPSVDPAQGR
jgi:hypothetical protein